MTLGLSPLARKHQSLAADCPCCSLFQNQRAGHEASNRVLHIREMDDIHEMECGYHMVDTAIAEVKSGRSSILHSHCCSDSIEQNQNPDCKRKG